MDYVCRITIFDACFISLQFIVTVNDTEIFLCINDTPLLNVTLLYVSKYTVDNILQEFLSPGTKVPGNESSIIRLINDLPSRVNDTTWCHLFADDCLLYRVVESIDDQVQLQGDLKALEAWASDWGMQFNPSKCHVFSINKRSSHRQSYFYELCGSVLTSVVNEKYLGVTASSDMSWSTNVNTICTKSSSSSWREAFSRSLPPLRSFARTVGPPLAAVPQLLLHPCRGRSGGSRWSMVGQPETRLHQEESERDSRGIETPGLLVRSVNLLREFRGGLPDGSRGSSTTPLVSLLCYTSSTLNPWRNVEELVASPFCTKSFMSMWRCHQTRDWPKPLFLVSAVAESGPKLNIQLQP